MKDFELTRENVGVVHFIGIGGVGMSGIAEVLISLGCIVQGSDLQGGETIERLRSFGARIFIGHRAENVEACDVVVVSSVILPDNPEVRRARALQIPVIKRAEMLAELMRFRYGIAVAGTHGKTTTTSLTAAVLAQGGLDPTFVIGGKVNSWGAGARLGETRYLVAEADESDSSFLHLQPMLAAVTNVDRDHLGAYEGDFEQLKQGFVDFIHNLPFYGTAVVCNEDKVIRSLYPRIARRFLTYGFRGDSAITATEVRFEGMQSRFKMKLPGGDDAFEVRLNLPGRHNILNALAASGIACTLGVPRTAIAEALSKFEGIGRRFQLHGELMVPAGRVTLIDDYGHHPREIRAVLAAAAESWPQRRRVLVFQPHRFTRTQDLFDEFCEVLSEVDDLILLDVYAASEEPIQGMDSAALCRSIRKRSGCTAIHVKRMEEVADVLAHLLRDDDLLFTMGAGSIGRLAPELVRHFRALRRPLRRV